MSRITLLLTMLLALYANPVQAELQITITEGVDKAIPIAVVPFGSQGTGTPPPLDAAAIVAADLARSGRFAPMDRKDMLQRPTTGAEVAVTSRLPLIMAMVASGCAMVMASVSSLP